MDNRIVIIALVLLVVVGLITLYGGNSLAPPVPIPTVEAPTSPTTTPPGKPVTQPTPTTPVP